MTISDDVLKPGIRGFLAAPEYPVLIRGKHDIIFKFEGLRSKALIREQDRGKIIEYITEFEENSYLNKLGTVSDVDNMDL